MHMVHTIEEVRTRTHADPNEAAPEAIMPQAAWEALLRSAVQGLCPPCGPRTVRQWLQANPPQAWAISPPPPNPTTTPAGRERARARGGQGAERDTPARGHRSAQGDRQAPIVTGHREQHNVETGNHPRARKGREQGPGRRERGHHGRHQDPHAIRAYHNRGTSAPTHPADAAKLPGTHAPNTRRRSANQTPYGTHRHTPAGHRKPHRGGMAHLHGENKLHPQRRPPGTPPRSPPPRPHCQATTPATTRATSQAPEEDKGTATAPSARDRDPQRTRHRGTGPQGGQPHRHLPDPPARAAHPDPHSTDPASHQHLTAPPSNQPATL